MRSRNIPRKPVVILLCIAVAALHLFTGPSYSGPARSFVTGHLIDLVLPFSWVLLLGINPGGPRFLRSPIARAALVFLLAAFVELAQLFRVSLFGSTFDPLDLMMYAIGVTAAIAFEQLVFSPHAHRTGA